MTKVDPTAPPSATRNVELAFAAKGVDLSVRSFVVEDGLSEIFEAYVTALSPDPNLDLGKLVGHGAALRLALQDAEDGYAIYSGVCSHAEQISTESDGTSRYVLRIVPMLWRTTQRSAYRIFQHKSAVDIARELLDEWDIVPELRVDADDHPRHAYRVQFGESDYAFLSRMLQEAGICFGFEQTDKRAEKKVDALELFLSDQPCRTTPRKRLVLPFVGDRTDDGGAQPFLTEVRFRHDARPGRVVLSGHEFRANPDLQIIADVRASIREEQRFEQYLYAPAAFQSASTRGSQPRPTRQMDGDQLDAKLGKRHAKHELDRLRTGQRSLVMRTNELRLRPGTVFTMLDHPRAVLCKKNGLLVVRRRIEGEANGQWVSRVEATLTEDPYVPARKTPKPRVMGVQSAIVMGPRGDEIHADAHGRVRVRFHWDRDSKEDGHTSCWLRVSQAWAGNGYGMMALPRVGHEVLVDFFDGDPDQPVVVGRVHHAGAALPESLPNNQTKTIWRSQSTPGGKGFNEISFDDARGEESVYIRAERNMTKLVRADEHNTVGANLTTSVRQDEKRTVGGSQELSIKGDRLLDVTGELGMQANSVTVRGGRKAGIHSEDGKLIITNGTASIVLDGPHIRFDAEANIRLTAGRNLELHGKQIEIDAAPDVLINTGEALSPQTVQLPVASRAREADRRRAPEGRQASRSEGRGRRGVPGGTDAAAFAALRGRRAKRDLPDEVRLPEGTERQLREHRSLSDRLGYLSGELLDADTYKDLDKRVERRLKAEENRLEQLGTDLHGMFESSRDRVDGLGDRLEERFTQEQDHLGRLNRELDAIFDGKRGNFVNSVKALGKAVGAQVKRISALRKDLVAMIARERAYFTNMYKTGTRKVKAFLGHFEHIAKHPGSLIVDIVMAGDKQLAEDIIAIAGLFGEGEAVADFLGMGGVAAGGSATGHGGGHGNGHGGGHGNGHGSGHGHGGRVDNTMGRDIEAGPDGDMPPDGLPSGADAAHTPADPGAGQGGQPADAMTHAKIGNTPQASLVGKPAAANGGSTLPAAGGGQSGNMVPMIAGIGGGAAAVAAGGGVAALTTGDGSASALGLASQDAGLPGHELASGSEPNLDGGHSDESSEENGSKNDVVVSRAGGLAPEDVVTTMTFDSLGFMQSPTEGQLMVVPTTDAVAPSPAVVEQAMVNAQMNGEPVEQAIAMTLNDHGFGVYHRSNEDALSGVLQLISKY